MPIVQNRGLRGLPGLNRLSEEERNNFYAAHSDILNRFHNPGNMRKAAEILYNNQQFVNTFGQDEFNKFNDGTAASYDLRNNMLTEKIVNDEWNRLLNPIKPNGIRDNNIGLGTDWEKYSEMSTDAKRQVLESGWLTPSEMKKENEGTLGWANTVYDALDWVSTLPTRVIKEVFPSTKDFLEAVDPRKGTIEGIREALNQYYTSQNTNILDNIYNNDIDATAKKLAPAVSSMYQDPSIYNLSDDQVVQAFVQAITPSRTNMGIPEYAAYYGNGSDVESEMKNFSIDEMREVLAKKAVYEQYMSPTRASIALNNEAKRYIASHQSDLTRFGLWARDTGISALSYSADKINGIYNAGLWVTDKIADTPIVYVDDRSEVISPDKVVRGANGVIGTVDEEGTFHPVHQEQIDRTTLHLMGKNFDGSEDEGLLNPLYWTRAEQFGTLDSDEQKQYEKLGVSPYKVAYNPNEESGLLYESFKMMSFGLADQAAMFIPFGVGTAGKVLSTAGKLGKVGKGLSAAMEYTGKAMQYTGEMLSGQSKIAGLAKAGQTTQGLLGAGGIAYAYERGAFQETLAQNLANAEQAVLDRSRNEIYNLYNTDEQYKATTDAAIETKAATLKAEYMAQMAEKGEVVDEKALDEMVHAKAQEQVLGDMVNQRVAQIKGSQEYADLQQEAIKSAGDAAWTTFWPEAIKYGYVNTIGFRKWLYTNPASLRKPVSEALKGIREVTTEGGLKRLGTETSKFLTRKDKIKQFGKVAGSQFWGGAWTNGTDDMMVDAAERINEDSFGRYVNAFTNGEAMADTYGFVDGIYSYWKGLGNSLGQETTWNAATVGGLGSLLSVTPNFVNIAHYFTKSGKQAYRDRYMQRQVYDTDSNGFKKPVRDENGKLVTENIKRSENWRDRFNYFIQNGVLNTYYGNKINEQDMQNHADYVNSILDSYDDFKVIEDLVASNMGLENATTTEDQKTMKFVTAIQTVNALNHLANDKNDPATLSSVVQDAKSLIERAAKMSFDPNEEGSFSDEEARNLVAQYYASNPGLPRNEYNSQKALYDISQNAQKLLEAAEVYDEAEEKIQDIENSLGRHIEPTVRNKMKLDQALDKHWRQRLDNMKSDIGDTSVSDELSEAMVLSVLGSKKNAEDLIKVYDKQHNELLKELEEQKKETAKKNEALKKAQHLLDISGNSAAKYANSKEVAKAQAEVDDALEQENYINDMMAMTLDKKAKVEQAIKSNADGEAKVLTADEILGLDPVSRAKMLRPENRVLYSNEQTREIDKLQSQLLMKDGDALQKVQDIALLTQRIANNQDAYSRMAKNPEAAAVALEAQRAQEADTAYKLINQRNAETIVDFINQFEEGMRGHNDVSQDTKNEFVFRALRKFSPTLLDIVEKDNMLPQYQQQVQDAKEWGKAVADIDAVINNTEEGAAWKSNVSQAIAGVVENAANRDGIITNLEKAIDDVQNPQVAQDFEKVLNGLNQLGYQRDATVIENRKQRKEREEAQRKAEEDRKKQLEAAVKEAEAKKAAEDAKKKAEEEEKKKGNDDGISSTQAEQDKLLEGKMGVDLGDLGFEEQETGTLQLAPPTDADLNSILWNPARETIVTKPSYHSSMKSQLGDKKSNWDYYTESEKETRDTPEGKVILGSAIQKALQPAINYAIDAGILDASHKIADTKASMENSNKIREAVKVLRNLGIETPQQLIDYVEQNNGKTIVGSRENTSESTGMGLQTKEVVDTIKDAVALHLQRYNSLAPVEVMDIDSDEDIAKIADGEEIQKVRQELKDSKLPAAFDPKAKRIYIFAQNLESSDAEEALFHESLHRGLQQYYGDGLIEVAEAFWDTESSTHPETTRRNKKAIEEKYADQPETVKEEYLVNVLAHQMAIGSAENILKRLSPEHQEIINNILHNIGYDTAKESTRRKEARTLASQGNGKVQETPLASNELGGGVEVTHDETLGDVIQGKSPSLEEQMTEAQQEGQGEVQDVTGLPNSDKENSRGEDDIETPSAPLNGVSMNEWVINKDTENAKHIKIGSPVRYEKDLQHDHVLVHKKGGKDGDSMNQFYEWLNNAGIKLQNIIDDELSQILTQNPHTPVMFMRLRPTGKVGDFRDDTLMLVVEYNSDVQKAHNDGNGGVITSDGKKYLIVGTVGYGDKEKNPDKFNLWKKLMDNHAPDSHKLKIKAWDWFKQDAHKHELYYIHPDFHTEIVPNSMIPGYLIRQNETDKTDRERSISELLNDKERNPHGYKLDDLGWAIQNMTSFWTTNTGGKMVMAPEHTIDNLGRVFVLVPAGNGKLMPAKIEPLHYADGMDENGNIVNPNALNRDSVLWKRIQDLLNQLTSPRYEDRQSAIKQLPMLLYFVPKDQGNKTILIGTDEHDNRVTVVNGAQRTTFFLDSNFNREEFFRAVREMNPRINVTPNALTNKERLRELEEIGALKTDIAKLGTCGVSYTIYGIDSDGNMVISERPVPTGQEVQSGNSENNVREFRYLYGNNYKYNIATGEFTKDGVPVTGDDMIEYAYKIGTQQVAPVKQEGVWQYYIISTGANPEVVRQNSIGRIEQLSKDEAQKVIDDEIARVAEEKRKWALEQALAEQQSNEENEPVPAIDEEGSLRFFDEENIVTPNRKPEENQATTPQPLTPSVSAEGPAAQRGTRTFKQLWRSSDRNKLLDVLRQKDWENVPMEDMGKLKKYLEDKGMQNLDMVGTSAVDYEAWLQKLRCL